MNAASWVSADGLTMERTAWTSTDTGRRLAGTTLTVVGGHSHELRWTVMTDIESAPSAVGVHVQGPAADRTLALTSDGKGSWAAGEQPVLDLYGAIDIEFGWTPATLLLPIWRLSPEIGETVELTVVHVAFPDHDITRQTRAYARLDETRYRIGAGDEVTEVAIHDGWPLHPRWRRLDTDA